MTLVLLQVMIQSISSTLHWVGLYLGIRALPGDQWRRRRWALGSAIIFTAWLIGVVLLAGNASSASTCGREAYRLRWC